MPERAASWAAVIGSIEPALFTPSVTRMMIRLRVFDVRSRFTQVAMAWPIAVPSPFSPTWARSRIALAISRSYVIGTRVAARTPNVTMPMRSSCRRAMKSPINSLATPNRLRGLKSSAAMLPEASRATTMSIPKRSFVAIFVTRCGRASATIIASAARHSRKNGTPASCTRMLCFELTSEADEIVNIPKRCRRSRTRSSTRPARARTSSSHSGLAKRIMPPVPSLGIPERERGAWAGGSHEACAARRPPTQVPLTLLMTRRHPRGRWKGGRGTPAAGAGSRASAGIPRPPSRRPLGMTAVSLPPSPAPVPFPRSG